METLDKPGEQLRKNSWYRQHLCQNHLIVNTMYMKAMFMEIVATSDPMRPEDPVTRMFFIAIKFPCLNYFAYIALRLSI